MSDIGYINITVTDSDVEYDSEFSVAEVIFWIELLKSMVLKKMIDGEELAEIVED